MNRFLYAEANPWTLVDPSGHMAGCASASSDLCNETTAVKYKNTPAGKTAKKKVSDHDHPCQGMSGADLAACRAPYSAPTPKAQSTPTCSSSICNASAPTTAVETDWSTWANAKIDWSTVGQSVCTAADPCVPQVECATALFGGPCLLTPFTNPVSAYECDSECQAEGFRLAIVLTVVTVGTYAAAAAAPAVITAIGAGGSPLLDRIKDLARSPGWGPSAPSVANPQLRTLIDQLYRPGAAIGNGGTADAIRAGLGHIQKGADYAVALQRWLTSNPDADATDIQTAESMLTDLLAALAGERYPGAK